jgi:hypothetical protein
MIQSEYVQRVEANQLRVTDEHRQGNHQGDSRRVP